MKTFLLCLIFSAPFILFAQPAKQKPGCLDSLNIATSFTPNGDTANDDFSIYFPCTPEKFEIHIYNRWGEEIFASESYTFRWDGKSAGGNYVSEGVYFYIVKFTYQQAEKQLTGNVTVLF